MRPVQDDSLLHAGCVSMAIWSIGFQFIYHPVIPIPPDTFMGERLSTYLGKKRANRSESGTWNQYNDNKLSLSRLRPYLNKTLNFTNTAVLKVGTGQFIETSAFELKCGKWRIFKICRIGWRRRNKRPKWARIPCRSSHRGRWGDSATNSVYIVHVYTSKYFNLQ